MAPASMAEAPSRRLTRWMTASSRLLTVQELAHQQRGQRRVEAERVLRLLSHMRPHGVALRAERGDVVRQARRHQNFTCGACCAESSAVNSAIGLVPAKKVFAQSSVGKVRSEVLNSRTASM